MRLLFSSVSAGGDVCHLFKTAYSCPKELITNSLTICFFLLKKKRVILTKQNQQTTKTMHNYQACKELTIRLLLLKSSAACGCLLEGLISANRQPLWTQNRLLLEEEQSDLGPCRFLQMYFQIIFIHDYCSRIINTKP